MSALAGTSFISGFNPTPIFTVTDTSILGIVLNVINNVGIFVAMIGVSSSFALFGTIILSAFGLTLCWCLLELFRGV